MSAHSILEYDEFTASLAFNLQACRARGAGLRWLPDPVSGLLIRKLVTPFLHRARVQRIVLGGSIRIDPSCCTGCGKCAEACPYSCIQIQAVEEEHTGSPAPPPDPAPPDGTLLVQSLTADRRMHWTLQGAMRNGDAAGITLDRAHLPRRAVLTNPVDCEACCGCILACPNACIGDSRGNFLAAPRTKFGPSLVVKPQGWRSPRRYIPPLPRDRLDAEFAGRGRLIPHLTYDELAARANLGNMIFTLKLAAAMAVGLFLLWWTSPE